MSKARQTSALRIPPADLSEFPRWRLRPDVVLRRAHTVGNSPWWFSSDLSGRFDLVPPNGTCYLATDLDTALRERFGHELIEQGIITFETATRTQVSLLSVPGARWLANACHRDAAKYGMTRELGTCAPYDVPQAWAAAFQESDRHTGIRYQTRFTTGARANAAALFDTAGVQEWPTDPDPVDGVRACAEVGITVARRPRRKEIRIQKPPKASVPETRTTTLAYPGRDVGIARGRRAAPGRVSRSRRLGRPPAGGRR
jgi:hypothetical protein